MSSSGGSTPSKQPASPVLSAIDMSPNTSSSPSTPAKPLMRDPELVSPALTASTASPSSVPPLPTNDAPTIASTEMVEIAISPTLPAASTRSEELAPTFAVSESSISSDPYVPDRHTSTINILSAHIRSLLLATSSETEAIDAGQDIDYDNPEDHILERKFDEDAHAHLNTISINSKARSQPSQQNADRPRPGPPRGIPARQPASEGFFSRLFSNPTRPTSGGPIAGDFQKVPKKTEEVDVEGEGDEESEIATELAENNLHMSSGTRSTDALAEAEESQAALSNDSVRSDASFSDYFPYNFSPTASRDFPPSIFARFYLWCAVFGYRMRPRWRKFQLGFLRFFITIVIAILIGLTGYCVSGSVSAIIRGHISVLNYCMSHGLSALAFFYYIFIACLCTGVAALFVTFGSWQTRGSGVGRLNAYLSGMSSSKFLALKALVVKIGGLILTVSSGIKLGMEGPFLHIGAMIGLHVSRSVLWLLDTFCYSFGVQKFTSILRGVVDERMFISGGAAAGFSVAFNAPIAGVLYVQDGAFAYWNGEYTVRTFLSTMVAVTTINLCYRDSDKDTLPSRGLIDIGALLSTTITLREFWGFFALGIIGGLMGILFTKANIFFEKLRHKYVSKFRLHNLLDVLAATALTIFLCFVIPFFFPCYTTNVDRCNFSDRCIQYQCGANTYNEMASLLFTLPEEVIRTLFDRSPNPDSQFSYGILFVFFLIYGFLSCYSYGMAVPGGLFIPGIIVGAAYGRFVGNIMQTLIPPDPALVAENILTVNPGIYAVLGSASMLGGITRMTLPITVMMVEITSDAQFLIPIMLVVLMSKFIADRGGGNLYSEHLKLEGHIMVFGDRPPPALKKLIARDLIEKAAPIGSQDAANDASPPNQTLAVHLEMESLDRESTSASASKYVIHPVNVIESLDRIRSLLETTTALAFPVVSTHEVTLRYVLAKLKIQGFNELSPASFDGVFLGLIQRSQLINAYHTLATFSSIEAARESDPLTSLPYDASLTSRSPRSQSRDNPVTSSFANWCASQATNVTSSLDSVNQDAIPASSSSSSSSSDLEQGAEEKYCNLAGLIDQGAYTVTEFVSARRIWSLFRSLGMTQIIVLDHQHRPMGLITRRDLIRAANH